MKLELHQNGEGKGWILDIKDGTGKDIIGQHLEIFRDGSWMKMGIKLNEDF